MVKRSVYAKVCTKRLVLILGLFFACFVPAIAQDIEFRFSNELSSDIVNLSATNGALNIDIPSIQDEVIVEMTSRRVDFGVDAVVNLDLDGLAYSIDDFDWYAAFRPVSVFEIGFSKDYYFRGSYVYIEDDNVAGSKMGSDGLSFAFLGDDVNLHGLKVVLTLPFDFDGSVNPFTSQFNFGVGVEYTLDDLFAVGAAVTNILNSDKIISVAAALFPLEGLEIHAGYNFNDQEGVCNVYGTHLMNASVAYTFDRFFFAFEVITNFGFNTGSTYDLYTALYEEFRVSDPVLIFLTLSEQNTIDSNIDWVFSVTPGVELNTAFGSFSLELKASFANGDFNVCFPFSWIYEF